MMKIDLSLVLHEIVSIYESSLSAGERMEDLEAALTKALEEAYLQGKENGYRMARKDLGRFLSKALPHYPDEDLK